ncbi:MAG: hypothetical protein WC901_01310 [Candidatus Margulisiibacteriota bacterium]
MNDVISVATGAVYAPAKTASIKELREALIAARENPVELSVPNLNPETLKNIAIKLAKGLGTKEVIHVIAVVERNAQGETGARIEFELYGAEYNKLFGNPLASLERALSTHGLFRPQGGIRFINC